MCVHTYISRLIISEGGGCICILDLIWSISPGDALETPVWSSVPQNLSLSSLSLTHSLTHSRARARSLSLSSLSLSSPSFFLCHAVVCVPPSALCSLSWRREHVRGGHLSQARDFAQNATMQMHLCGGRHCSGRVRREAGRRKRRSKLKARVLRRRALPCNPPCRGLHVSHDIGGSHRNLSAERRERGSVAA